MPRHIIAGVGEAGRSYERHPFALRLNEINQIVCPGPKYLRLVLLLRGATAISTVSPFYNSEGIRMLAMLGPSLNNLVVSPLRMRSGLTMCPSADGVFKKGSVVLAEAARQ